MNPELLQTVNWKTVGWGIGYGICKAVGKLFPEIGGSCEVLETFTVMGGLISAADADRVKNVVRAVDALLWKNKMDPATLVPLDAAPTVPTPAAAPVPAT